MRECVKLVCLEHVATPQVQWMMSVLTIKRLNVKRGCFLYGFILLPHNVPITRCFYECLFISNQNLALLIIIRERP